MNIDGDHRSPGPLSELVRGGGYLKLLGLDADALAVIDQIDSVVQSQFDSHRRVLAMLADPGWRAHLVACIAVLVSADQTSFVQPLWGTLDGGSWVAPQLAVTLLHCDPSFVTEAKRRIASGCSVAVPSTASDLLRHVTTGPASPIERSSKNMASLLRLVGTLPSEREWAQETDKIAAVQEVLRSDRDRSGELVLQWDARLSELFARQGRYLRSA